MKLTQYRIGKSFSVLKLYLLCSQQQSVLNIMDKDKVRNLQYQVFTAIQKYIWVPYLVFHINYNASSMAPLHSLGQDGVEHDFYYHVRPLALASHDANCVINGTFAFLRSRH